MKVYDPLKNTFVLVSSERGKIIAQYNELCEKCKGDNIIDVNTGKCKNWKENPKIAEEFSKQIEYCQKYYKAYKKVASSDKKIIDNILNIKIKNDLKIKDVVSAIGFDGKIKDLAKRLNIKNAIHAEYINLIPIIISVLVSINPSIRDPIIKVILSILKRGGEGIASLLLGILGSPYLLDKKGIVSNIGDYLSPAKMIGFISGLLAAFSNRGDYNNKYEFTKVSDKLAENMGFYRETDYNPEIIDRKTKVLFYENEELRSSYDEVNKKLNLARLGLSSRELYEDKKLKFTMNNSGDISAVSFKLGEIPIITSKEDKEKLIEDLNIKYNYMLDKVENTIKEINSKIKENKDIKRLELLKSKLSSVKSDSGSKETLKKSIDEIEKNLKSKKKNVIDTGMYEFAINMKDFLKTVNKRMNTTNDANFNYNTSIIKKEIEDASKNLEKAFETKNFQEPVKSQNIVNDILNVPFERPIQRIPIQNQQPSFLTKPSTTQTQLDKKKSSSGDFDPFMTQERKDEIRLAKYEDRLAKIKMEKN